jgi:hypothetical protein
VKPALRLLALTPLAALGCGTWLSVSGAGIDDRDPGGIAVNQRAFYEVRASCKSAKLELCKDGGLRVEQKLATVDPGRVVAVDWTRMPFSSGELQMKVTKEQTLREVTLLGSTGGARAANAGSAVVDALSEIEKQRAAGETP